MDRTGKTIEEGGLKIETSSTTNPRSSFLDIFRSQESRVSRQGSERASAQSSVLTSDSRRLAPDKEAVSASGQSVLLLEVIIVLAAGILSFSQLDCSLQEPEETLYAEVPRQMLAQGQMLVPMRHGQPFYDKPPLFYWLVMGMYQLCGVHDWAARFVSSAAAFLCALVTYAWGKWTVGPRVGFAGALMLCLSPRWAELARMVSTNSLLTLWVVAALAAAHLALRRPRVNRSWWLLSALFCGLGILTKGPVALVLIAGPALLHQWLNRSGARVGWRMWVMFFALVGLVALPWYVILAVRDPSFLYYFVWIHHVRRVLDPIDHPQPFWYYGPVLLLGMMPWTFLLPGLVKHLVSQSEIRGSGNPSRKERGSRKAAKAQRDFLPLRLGVLARDPNFETDRHAPPDLSMDWGFVLLAGSWSLLFFSAAICKRPCYILPIMPPLALALGFYVDALWQKNLKYIWTWAAAVVFLLLLLADHYLLPSYADKYSVRGRIIPFVGTCREDTPVLCYPHIWDGVSFYLQRNDVQVYHSKQLKELVSALQEQPQSLVVIKEDASLDRFLEALPKSMEFVPCTRQHPVAVGWVRRR
jgi:4-amino-4-deoxy-L-arabinose transferase-like glycosyltransferase